MFIPILDREGYTVIAPPNPLRGLMPDSAYLASYLSTISGPIVLVGHSYGAAVITNAAVGNANVKIAPGTDYTGFDACFATFVPRGDAAVLAAVQRPLALGAFTAVSGTPAWASIPSWAVIGTQDQAIPSAELTFMAQRAQSKITYVTAGHLSMITQPRVVADVISNAAEATR
jgi:pimeloyl-ACP methyl ester carboxylesterase